MKDEGSATGWRDVTSFSKTLAYTIRVAAALAARYAARKGQMGVLQAGKKLEMEQEKLNSKSNKKKLPTSLQASTSSSVHFAESF